MAKMAASEGQDSLGAILQGSDVQGTVRIDPATHLITRLVLLIGAPQSGTATLTISAQAVAGLLATQAGTITITLTGAGNSVGPVSDWHHQPHRIRLHGIIF